MQRARLVSSWVNQYQKESHPQRAHEELISTPTLPTKFFHLGEVEIKQISQKMSV